MEEASEGFELHPDNIHLGFSAFVSAEARFQRTKVLRSTAVLALLGLPGFSFPARYDIVNMTSLLIPANLQPVFTQGTTLVISPRQFPWANSGASLDVETSSHMLSILPSPATWMRMPSDCRAERVRPITTHPEYVDQIDRSPDDRKW